MNIKCDKCGHIFELAENDLKQNNLGKGVIRTYFSCPACNEEFTAYYTDEKIRYNQNKINQLSKKLKKPAGSKTIEVNDEMTRLTEINKEGMARLRREYEGGE